MDVQQDYYTILDQKVLTFEEILSNVEVFNSGFVNEIQNSATNKIDKKSCLVE